MFDRSAQITPHAGDASGSRLHLRLRRGRGPETGTPDPLSISNRTVGAVGLMGADYPGLIFDPCVALGEVVCAGQPVAKMRHDPRLTLTAPVAGTLTQVTRGARRRLQGLTIAPQGDGAISFDTKDARHDGAALRALLLAAGAWPGFTTRPFGRVPEPGVNTGAKSGANPGANAGAIPDANANAKPDANAGAIPGAIPGAIFITATPSTAAAPDPVHVLRPVAEAFEQGVRALQRLTEGPVFLCQPEGAPLVAGGDGVVIVHVSGPYPAGLAGPQIHALFPVSNRRSVWQIGYQDVLAIGHLLITGQVMGSRVISLSGAGLQPALIRVPLGASLGELTGELRGEILGDTAQAGRRDHGVGLVSGPAPSGRASAYLGRYDLQITATAPATKPAGSKRWWHPGHVHETPPAILPNEAFERAFPFDILPVPLMRALACGDIESASRLGCLELLDEDMAVLSGLCPSGNDYGRLLRVVLDALDAEQRV